MTGSARAGIHNHKPLNDAQAELQLRLSCLWIPGSRCARPMTGRGTLANAPPPVWRGVPAHPVPFSSPSEEGNGAPGGARALRYGALVVPGALGRTPNAP